MLTNAFDHSVVHYPRDAEVLSVFATVINKLKEAMEPEVPRIFESCFECTLQMITKNFEVCTVNAWGDPPWALPVLHVVVAARLVGLALLLLLVDLAAAHNC